MSVFTFSSHLTSALGGGAVPRRGVVEVVGDEFQLLFQNQLKVRHGVEQAGDELTSIVDAGGAVLNVIVNHRVYGKITADLDIRNRRDVERYLHDIESGKSFPLLTVTSGYHFHRIAAEDEQTLDEIEAMLKEKGYLADLMPYEDDLS